jgi:hypothetical protein
MEEGDERNLYPVNLRVLCRLIEGLGDGDWRDSEIHD